MATATAFSGDPDAAIAIMQDRIGVCVRVLGATSPDALQMQAQFIIWHWQADRFDEFLADCPQILDRLEGSGLGGDGRTIFLHEIYGEELCKGGKTTPGVSELTKALEGYVRLGTHPEKEAEVREMISRWTTKS